MIRRLTRWLWALAVSLDQLAHVLLSGPKYLLLGGPAPNPDETISSKVGRMAVAGKRWALIAEAVIDWIFIRLGDGPGHCRRNIGR
ncbi:hypothetical protein [Sphingomonas sp. KC8]|uniref:hypothetical protein n=1 Tax=Sphingomonas sp. KC8 TaxID=1030157 RepID=UPI00024897CE|nr:hypothetical protein [Sphingomonas sp. KC8]ARS29090.1 hypothetical protein KC8_17610 [Sphingomonas sp. KC8]